jgi:hypothetical protein
LLSTPLPLGSDLMSKAVFSMTWDHGTVSANFPLKGHHKEVLSFWPDFNAFSHLKVPKYLVKQMYYCHFFRIFSQHWMLEYVW